VVSSGITAMQPDIRKHNGRDNAVGIVEFHVGRIAYLYCSRMMAARSFRPKSLGLKGS